MKLKNLSLINFRNFSKESFSTTSDHIVLLGRNGTGKTNFLEAVNYLSITKSFRTSQEDTLIKNGESFFTVSGHISDDECDHKIEVIYSETKSKQVTLDGKKIPVRNLITHMRSVVFHTDDIELFRGPSVLRRRYIDLLLCQTDVNYYHHLVVYNHLLRQKKEILKKKTFHYYH